MTSNTPVTQAPFEREGRYVILKIKRLTTDQLEGIRGWMHVNQVKGVDAVVVEADWPEYETVWQMIEDRVTGRHRQSSSNAGGVDNLDARKAVNNVLAGLLAPLMTDIPKMIEVGNQACTEILAALASLSTPMAEPMRDETLRAALATIQAMIGNVDHSRGHGPNAAEMRGGMLNDIRDLCNRALTTPPTPDRIGKDAVREAAEEARNVLAWIFETSDDHQSAMKAETAWRKLDAALSATPAQEGED